MFLTQLWDNLLKRIAIALEKTSTDNKITRLVWSYRQIMTPGRLRHATTTITTFVATRISSYYVTVFFRAFRFRLAWFLRLCSLYYHWSVSLTLWVYSWSDEVLIAEFLTEDLRVGFFFGVSSDHKFLRYIWNLWCPKWKVYQFLKCALGHA